jgi:rare lipoprotein A
MPSCARPFFAALLVAATPLVSAAQREQFGLASWYGDELRGRKTANGEAFNPDSMTAAHPTLPFGSLIEITALDTGRTIRVRINDRGPYHGGRILDMSFASARALGMTGHGARPVRIVTVSPSDKEARAFREGRVSAFRPAAPLSHLAAWRLRANWTAPIVTVRAIPSGRGPLWLQVGSFSSPSRAVAMANRLGGTISILGGIYRVRLGPYADAAQATGALAPLAAKGYPDAIIVR